MPRETPTCYLCGMAAKPMDYCMGCRNYICSQCDFGTDETREHDPEDHDNDNDSH